jgi:prolyl-tRNA editing enzyme YbaK/EbsC (Cys-tRNA(Pro) deacylase)
MTPKLGDLDWKPAADHPELLAPPVTNALGNLDAYVAAINPALADTEACSRAYEIPMDAGANCVIIRGKRADLITTAAVVILGSDRADINNVVRKHLGVRKASFLPLDEATTLTSMEYGGITPIGLPMGWPILVDEGVTKAGWVIIGSGIRASKIAIRGEALATLPDATVLPLAAS